MRNTHQTTYTHTHTVHTQNTDSMAFKLCVHFNTSTSDMSGLLPVVPAARSSKPQNHD